MIYINGYEFEIREEDKEIYSFAEKLSKSENTISLYCIKKDLNDLILLINLKTHKFTYIPISIFKIENPNSIIKYFIEENIMFLEFSKFKIIYRKDTQLQFEIDRNTLNIYSNIFKDTDTYSFDEIENKRKESSKPTFRTYELNFENNLENYDENNVEEIKEEPEFEILNSKELKTLLSIKKDFEDEENEEIENNIEFTKEDKIQILKQILNINENTIIINVVNREYIISVNKKTGKTIKVKNKKLISKNTQIKNMDELLSLLKIDITTLEDIDNVICCDIRISYKYYKNKNLENEKIKNINYIINNNVMFLSYIDNDFVKQNISIKEYSSQIYNNKELQVIRKKLIEELETYGTKIFYIIFEDHVSILKTFIKEETFEEIDIDKLYSLTENKETIFDLNTCFKTENIINLGQYQINSVEKIKPSSKKIIDLCKYKELSEENDDLSYGLDDASNVLFYFIEEY